MHSDSTVVLPAKLKVDVEDEILPTQHQRGKNIEPVLQEASGRRTNLEDKWKRQKWQMSMRYFNHL